MYLMKDASEIVRYDTEGIPLFIKTENLSEYPDMRALCHWHDDIELIRILKGNMNYRVNDQKIHLLEGDCLIVNSRQMHYGYASGQNDCRFLCVLFHPQFFAGSPGLYERYVLPFIKNNGIEFLHLPGRDASACTPSVKPPSAVRARELLDRIAALKEELREGYELEASGLLHLLWNQLLSIIPIQTDMSEQTDPDLFIQRDMVSFIHQSYAEKITLDDIAAAGKVSRSKCCRIFREYLQQTPIDFLNHYRLEISRRLLEETSLSVTGAATACGFAHLSYYSRLFRESYGCTPREYRKKNF